LPHLTYPLDDDDDDEVPDIWEPTLMGIATDPNNPDTYNVGEHYPPTATYGDAEIRCQMLETELTFSVFPAKDWANPGSQHKNQFGPKVNP